jgi:transcriptional regulator with XRE-family HTH domain
VEGVDSSTDIREFLTSRRARITPDQAGLPAYGARRRVAGLRREEAAMLAGISVEYYTRLDRGNASGVSEDVLEGIARALQLDEAERAHLFDLFRTASRARTARGRPSQERVRPAVRRILDAMAEVPAYVRNDRLDILTANPLGLALYSPVFADLGGTANMARFIFLNPQATDFFHDWDHIAHDAVAILRRGRAEPLRPAALRSHRRAVHPQRRVPDPLGGPQRQVPPHRKQDPPPPGRRRPHPHLRSTRVAR